MKTLVWIVLPVILGISCVASLSVGDQYVAATDVIRALTGNDDTPVVARLIVTDIRLPRTVLAALVGAALAIAGATTQALMRNPLAEPGLLGINAGAALAGMIVIVSAQSLQETLLPVFSFGGALAMTIAIYCLSWRSGTTSLRIILVGIGLGAMAGAFASFLSVFGPAAEVQRALVWLSGSLNDSRWEKSVWILLWGYPAGCILLLMTRELDLLAMGDGIAKALGQRVNLVRGLASFAVAMLAGAAVAASGPIAFVGLAAPHMARRLVSSSHAALIPASALTGATLVVLADLAARRIVAPAQLPVGLMTALLGAPFFAYLLWKHRNE